MAKYAVLGIIGASKFLGHYEAESEEEAIDKAEKNSSLYVSICHQCAEEIDIGEIYEIKADKIDD